MSMADTIEGRTVAPVEGTDPSVNVGGFGETSKFVWEGLGFFSASRLDEFQNHLNKGIEKGVEDAFLMFFGLYRIEGDEKKFEDMAVEFAVNSGNSPPMWLDAHTRKKTDENTAVHITVNQLTADNIIETTIKMENPKPLIIDLGNVVKIDVMGIDLFNESLSARLERQEKTKILNGEKIVKNFLESVKGAHAKNNSGVWGFVFNYLRMSGSKSTFDNVAQIYVDAGGEKPTWTDLSDADEEKTEDIKGTSGAIMVEERLSSLNIEFARKLIRSTEGAQAKSSGNPLILDLTNTRQASLLDIVALDSFMKLMTAERITVSMINVNEIIHFMLRAFGVNKSIASISAPGSN